MYSDFRPPILTIPRLVLIPNDGKLHSTVISTIIKVCFNGQYTSYWTWLVSNTVNQSGGNVGNAVPSLPEGETPAPNFLAMWKGNNCCEVGRSAFRKSNNHLFPERHTDRNSNNWSKNFDKRPHRRLVTPRDGKWIRPTLTPCNTRFLGPTRVTTPNGILIGSAVLQGSRTWPTDGPTKRPSNRPRYSVCSNRPL